MSCGSSFLVSLLKIGNRLVSIVLIVLIILLVSIRLWLAGTWRVVFIGALFSGLSLVRLSGLKWVLLSL